MFSTILRTFSEIMGKYHIFEGIPWGLKALTHEALHDHTDHTFDRSAVGMPNQNVHV